jgi:hypothetical protein
VRHLGFQFLPTEIEAPTEQSWRKSPEQWKISCSDMFRFGISPQKTATGEKLGVRIGKSLATKAVNGRCLAKNRNFVNQKHEFQEISRYPVDDLSVHFS